MSERINVRLPDELVKDCKLQAKAQGITLTDMIVAGLQDQLYSRNTTEKPPTKDMPVPSKSPVSASCEVKKPADKPVIAKVEPEAGKPLANGYIPKSASQLKAEYKNNHPMDICQGCHNFNRDCVCGATVYVPDPVRPAKQPKVSASKAIQPIVKAMLSGIVKQPTVSHHPCCNCGVCKPLSDKLARL